MLKKIVFYFLFIINLFSLTKFGENLENSYKINFTPSIIKKTDEGYFLYDYFNKAIMVHDLNFKLKDILKIDVNINDFYIYDNKIYYSNGESGTFEVFDIKNKSKEILGDKGFKNGEYTSAGEVNGQSGYVYIVDENNSKISIYNIEKKITISLNLPKIFKKSLYKLNYSINKNKDKIYVLDKTSKKVYVFKNNKIIEEINLKNFNDPIKLYFIKNKMYVYEATKNEFIDLDSNEKIKLDLKNSNNIFGTQFFGEDKLGIYLVRDSSFFYFSFVGENHKELAKISAIKKGVYVKPIEVDMSIDGNVYILDQILNSILIFDSNGNFLKEINNLPQDIHNLIIDNKGYIYLLSNRNNSIYKLDKNGNMLRKIENSNDFLGNEKKSKKDSFIYENFLVKTDNDFFYYVSNNNKIIRKYYFDFTKGNEIGKKESSKNIISNKISVGTFSNYGNYKNSIKDAVYYQGKLYVLDIPYKRILVFSNEKFEKNLTNEKLSQGITSMSIFNNKIYLIDSNNYYGYKCDMNLKVEKEVNFAKLGYKPLKISEKYLILAKYSNYFIEDRIVIDINTIF
ncbi:MAG: hypothetical protein JW924_01420 [Fusobacteriaceae bacterium]|nr:hypothetical protein [Fusobacteriaceae bacterium]